MQPGLKNLFKLLNSSINKIKNYTNLYLRTVKLKRSHM